MTDLPTCLRAADRAVDAAWGYAKETQRMQGYLHDWRAAVGLILLLGDIRNALMATTFPQKHSSRQRNTAGHAKALVQQMPHPAINIKEVRNLKAAVLDLPSGNWGNTL